MLTLTLENCRLYSVSQRSARWPATASGLVHRTEQRGVPTRLAHADGILRGRKQPSAHFIRMSYQCVSHRGPRRTRMSRSASSDRETLLPFTPEVLLLHHGLVPLSSYHASAPLKSAVEARRPDCSNLEPLTAGALGGCTDSDCGHSMGGEPSTAPPGGPRCHSAQSLWNHHMEPCASQP